MALMAMRLQFVTAAWPRMLSPKNSIMGLVLGGAMVNIGLGSLDGDVLQVLLGLGTLGCGMVVRASFLKKRWTTRYENDPHLGENRT